MKMKWFWMMCMIVMTSLVTVSCGDDDDEGGSGNAPEGAITVNLTSNSGGAYANFGGGGYYGELKWESSTNNFVTHPFFSNYAMEIVSLGGKNGLGNINTNAIPESGWAYTIACKAGHAYMTRAKERDGDNAYYTGIYVVRNISSTSGGIMGVEIQYCTFIPGKGWNQ